MFVPNQANIHLLTEQGKQYDKDALEVVQSTFLSQIGSEGTTFPDF